MLTGMSRGMHRAADETRPAHDSRRCRADNVAQHGIESADTRQSKSIRLHLMQPRQNRSLQ